MFPAKSEGSGAAHTYAGGAGQSKDPVSPRLVSPSAPAPPAEASASWWRGFSVGSPPVHSALFADSLFMFGPVGGEGEAPTTPPAAPTAHHEFRAREFVPTPVPTFGIQPLMPVPPLSTAVPMEVVDDPALLHNGAPARTCAPASTSPNAPPVASNSGTSDGNKGEGEDGAPASPGGSEEMYVVERVLDKSVGEKGEEACYLVKWEGYDTPSWEPESQLMQDCPGAVNEFLASLEDENHPLHEEKTYLAAKGLWGGGRAPRSKAGGEKKKRRGQESAKRGRGKGAKEKGRGKGRRGKDSKEKRKEKGGKRGSKGTKRKRGSEGAGAVKKRRQREPREEGTRKSAGEQQQAESGVGTKKAGGRRSGGESDGGRRRRGASAAGPVGREERRRNGESSGGRSRDRAEKERVPRFIVMPPMPALPETRPPPPSFVPKGECEILVVEDLLDSRVTRFGLEFLVAWKGHSAPEWRKADELHLESLRSSRPSVEAILADRRAACVPPTRWQDSAAAANGSSGRGAERSTPDVTVRTPRTSPIEDRLADGRRSSPDRRRGSSAGEACEDGSAPPEDGSAFGRGAVPNRRGGSGGTDGGGTELSPAPSALSTASILLEEKIERCRSMVLGGLPPIVGVGGERSGGGGGGGRVTETSAGGVDSGERDGHGRDEAFYDRSGSGGSNRAPGGGRSRSGGDNDSNRGWGGAADCGRPGSVGLEGDPVVGAGSADARSCVGGKGSEDGVVGGANSGRGGDGGHREWGESRRVDGGGGAYGAGPLSHHPARILCGGASVKACAVSATISSGSGWKNAIVVDSGSGSSRGSATSRVGGTEVIDLVSESSSPAESPWAYAQIPASPSDEDGNEADHLGGGTAMMV